jgi:hypothetical protein
MAVREDEAVHLRLDVLPLDSCLMHAQCQGRQQSTL